MTSLARVERIWARWIAAGRRDCEVAVESERDAVPAGRSPGSRWLTGQPVAHPACAGMRAMASIEMSSPRGSLTLAGAERAGGGAGMCLA